MATSVLDQLVESRIASVGYLSLPFKNYYTYSSTTPSGGGTTRFSANSASLDKIWITYRPTTFATTPAGVHVVSGYKVKDGLVRIASALKNGATSATTQAFDAFVGTTPRIGDFVSGAVTAGSPISRITAVDSATQVTTADNMTFADNVNLEILRDMGLTKFDAGGVLNTNKEKYISKYFRFTEPLASASTPAK